MRFWFFHTTTDMNWLLINASVAKKNVCERKKGARMCGKKSTKINWNCFDRCYFFSLTFGARSGRRRLRVFFSFQRFVNVLRMNTHIHCRVHCHHRNGHGRHQFHLNINLINSLCWTMLSFGHFSTLRPMTKKNVNNIFTLSDPFVCGWVDAKRERKKTIHFVRIILLITCQSIRLNRQRNVNEIHWWQILSRIHCHFCFRSTEITPSKWEKWNGRGISRRLSCMSVCGLHNSKTIWND